MLEDARRTRWRRFALVAAVLVGGAGATLTATTLAGLTFDGLGSTEGRETPKLWWRLDFCVEALEVDEAREVIRGDPLLELRVKSSVEAALIEVMEHPIWMQSHLEGPSSPVVNVDCPTPPLPVVSNVAWEEGYPTGYDADALVTTRSPYVRHIYIMPREEIDQLLGGLSNRVAVQEIECGGDVCEGITHAIYLTREETLDTTFLVDTLEMAYGLEPPPGY